jgi:hypothetical protein
MSFLVAQELPPVVKYTPAMYNGNQNWMNIAIVIIMFFANNEGLLEFNGAS